MTSPSSAQHTSKQVGLLTRTLLLPAQRMNAPAKLQGESNTHHDLSQSSLISIILINMYSLSPNHINCHLWIRKNRRLVVDELVEFEKQPVEVVDFRKLTDRFRGIYRIYLPGPWLRHKLNRGWRANQSDEGDLTGVWLPEGGLAKRPVIG